MCVGIMDMAVDIGVGIMGVGIIDMAVDICVAVTGGCCCLCCCCSSGDFLPGSLIPAGVKGAGM